MQKPLRLLTLLLVFSLSLVGVFSCGDVDDVRADDDFPDDYVASWPQSNIENHDYDETVAAGPLRLKAEEYDQFNAEWFHPYYGGMVSKVKFSDESHSEVEDYGWWGDSTHWTAVYLVSQVMRYYITGDLEAKGNAIRSVEALDRHLQVTGRCGFLSRYTAPQDSLHYINKGGDEWCDTIAWCHHIEEGEFAGDFWEGETSRDMYIGWFFGMSLAYDLLDDPDACNTIATNVTEVLDELMAHNWLIIDIDGLPSRTAPNAVAIQKLCWSLIGYHITGEDRYRTEVQKWITDSRRSNLRLGNINLVRYGAYFPNNLGHASMYPLLRLAKVYLGPDDYDFLVELFETQTHTFTRLSHNPYFNTIFMSQGRYDPAEPEYQAQLEQDLSEFRPAPLTEYYVDPTDGVLDPFSIFLSDLIARYPFLEYLFGPVKPQSLEAHPVPEQCSTDFLWRGNPFRIEPCGANRPNVTMSGTDYLIAYWMASYHKFITKDD